MIFQCVTCDKLSASKSCQNVSEKQVKTQSVKNFTLYFFLFWRLPLVFVLSFLTLYFVNISRSYTMYHIQRVHNVRRSPHSSLGLPFTSSHSAPVWRCPSPGEAAGPWRHSRRGWRSSWPSPAATCSATLGNSARPHSLKCQHTAKHGNFPFLTHWIKLISEWI